MDVFIPDHVSPSAPGYIATDVSAFPINCVLSCRSKFSSYQMNAALLTNEVRSRQIFERMPIGRWGQPSDFEGAIVYLASKASDYVCGETLVVDGGWMAR